MRTMMFVLAATLAVGCKDKAKPAAGAGAGSGSGSAAVGSGSGSEAKGSAGAPKPHVIVLPRLEGEEATKGPDKPGRRLTAADFAKLADFQYVGFTHELTAAADTLFEVQYKMQVRPRLGVTVRIVGCSDKPDALEETVCRPLNAKAWKGRDKVIKASLGGGLDIEPSTIVEVGEVDVGGGEKAIFHYQVGYNIGSAEKGAGAYTNQYVIHFHDGVNQLHVTAEYRDDPTATMKDMLNLAPREDLAKIARRFFDVFSHAWGDPTPSPGATGGSGSAAAPAAPAAPAAAE